MIRRQDLSKAIDTAFHEHHCGSPPSCGVIKRRGAFAVCEGQLGAQELQAVVNAAFGALAHERACQPIVEGYVWCHHHGSVHPEERDIYDEGATGCNKANWERIRMAGDDAPKWREWT